MGRKQKLKHFYQDSSDHFMVQYEDRMAEVYQTMVKLKRMENRRLKNTARFRDGNRLVLAVKTPIKTVRGLVRQGK